MLADPYLPDFPGAVVEHGGLPYNLHRHYRDRDGRTWACLKRTTDPVWVRACGETGIPLETLVAEHGPLELLADAFWDATDEELSELVAEALGAGQ
jgi:hypothetical protein